MTPTSLQKRAEEICLKINGQDEFEMNQLKQLIIEALRQTREEALEEALEACDTCGYDDCKHDRCIFQEHRFTCEFVGKSRSVDVCVGWHSKTRSS